MAYIIPAKVTACTLIDLLTDPAKLDTIREAKAGKRSRDEYLDAVRAMRQDVVGDYQG